MPGPPPKPASERRRRNKPTPPAAVLPAKGSGVKAPKLPGASKMLAETRAWWKATWDSPVAARWIEADTPSVIRLAQLHDLTARQFKVVSDGPLVYFRSREVGVISRMIDAGLDDLEAEREIVLVFDSPVVAAYLSEMRQLEDRLGLTPMARRRLGWEIEDEDKGAKEAAPTAAPDELGARRMERFQRAGGA